MKDLDLIKYFMEAKHFRSTRQALPDGMFGKDVTAMLSWFAAYYKKYPEDTHISVDKLSLMMKLNSGMDEATFMLYQPIYEAMRKPLDLTIKHGILESLEERRLEGEVALLLERFKNGDEVDLGAELMIKTQESMKRRKVTMGSDWEDGDVGAMVLADADNSGYVFDFLPDSFSMQLKGVNEGDNICVGAPTNKGKTSFLANCAVSFAKQRKKAYDTYLQAVADGKWEGADMEFRPVLVLINEGNAKRITPRVYQTALGITREKMLELVEKGTLEQEYIKVMGRRDAIRLRNIHGLSIHEIMKILEAHNPFLVISDMTGRIRAGDNKGGMNDTAQLEHVWNTMREFASDGMYNCIHIGTVQISAEGFDMLHPPVSAVQNSKTGIQTTWDLAIYVGAMMNPVEGSEGIRGISTPKSKLAKAGYGDYIKDVTNFNAELNTWS